MTASNSNQTFFNLHIQGIGYVNRIREVQPNRGSGRRAQPFLACDISALNGPSDDISYTRFDCKVAGAEAQKIVKKLLLTVQDRKDKGQPEPKILISFNLGDLYTETFVYRAGEKAGQTGVSLKARLLFIKTVKIDGKLVYSASTEDENSGSSTEASAAATNESDNQASSDHSSHESLAASEAPATARQNQYAAARAGCESVGSFECGGA